MVTIIITGDMGRGVEVEVLMAVVVRAVIVISGRHGCFGYLGIGNDFWRLGGL